LLTSEFAKGWSQIRIYDYLAPKENITYRYDCFFVKEKDTLREVVEYEYKFVYMADDHTSEMQGEVEIELDKAPLFTKSQLAGKKIYYLERKDNHSAYGSNHFLFSAMAPIQGEIALAPYYFPGILNTLSAENFTNALPEFVDANDTLKLISGERTTLLYGFKLEPIELPTSPGKIECLKIEQEDRWPKNIYHAQIWISLEYGIVQWIRPTGRTETLLFR
jgi:hypothetical protein